MTVGSELDQIHSTILVALSRIETATAEILSSMGSLHLEHQAILEKLGDVDPPPPPPPPPPPTQYLPPWDEVADEPFDRVPHPTSTHKRAIKSIDQKLFWKGLHWPEKALDDPDYPWPYQAPGQPSIDRERAEAIVEESLESIERLRHMILLDDDDLEPIGGRWTVGKTREKRFNEWLAGFNALDPWLNAITGIQGDSPAPDPPDSL